MVAPRSLLCVAALACCGLAACASSAPEPAAEPRAHESFGYDAAGVPWALRPAVDELVIALRARDDELAERLLARLAAQAPPAALAERLEIWSRLLEGRALVRALAPRLECRRVEVAAGMPERRSIVLCVSNPHAEPLVLDCAPPRLVQTSTWIDERGELARNQQTSTLHAFQRLELPATNASEVVLAEFEPRTGRALAVRERLELVWSAGVLRRGARAVPFDREARCACDYVGLAGRLPTAAVEPAELVRYARGATCSTPALVERAVRIAPARYEEALDAVAAIADELTRERIVELAPALRWLAREPALGADAQGWQEWLRARHNRAAARAAPSLDLP